MVNTDFLSDVFFAFFIIFLIESKSASSRRM